MRYARELRKGIEQQRLNLKQNGIGDWNCSMMDVIEVKVIPKRMECQEKLQNLGKPVLPSTV